MPKVQEAEERGHRREGHQQERDEKAEEEEQHAPADQCVYNNILYYITILCFSIIQQLPEPCEPQPF